MSVDEHIEEREAPLVIGVDLGGTQIRAAVLQGAQIRARAAALTGHDATPERVLPRIYATMQEALTSAGVTLDQITGIGVAAPGPLDNREGVLYSPPNLPTWQAVPLRELLSQYFQLPVFVENDANAAALGEFFFGAGQGSRDMVYLTVSTGIGGGIIANGQILEGTNGTAGELGHITIDWRGERCSCGSIGCLEALASGTAIARKANQAIMHGEGADLLNFASLMAEHPTTVPDKKALPDQNFSTQPLNSGSLANPEAALPTQEWKVTAQTVARAAEAGIPIAREIITEAAEALGFGLVNILHTFSPEIVILGGGVMQMGALIMEPALKVVHEHTMRANMAKTRIVLAQLGINAGLVGAGALPAYYREQREGMAAHQGMGEDKA
ncbi:MAG TPA: ROK family protein [Ktedonobacteraceae bacterium]|jgi:glucokinase